MEHRLVRLGLDLAEAVHAAHVVHAVHDAASSGSRRQAGADHRVARDQRRRAAPRSSLRCRRAHRQHDEAGLGGRIPHADLGVGSAASTPKSGKHAARIGHGARAIGRRLVPDRRQAEHFPRIAGAQRAHDHVVPLRRVLDRDQMIAHAADEPSAATALVASSISACLNAGSIQALATTRAPLCGPILVS